MPVQTTLQRSASVKAEARRVDARVDIEDLAHETYGTHDQAGAHEMVPGHVAAFDSDYTDMQITYRGPAPAGVAPFLTNAGKATIRGAEAELTWAPTVNWTLQASVGQLKGSIDRLDINPLAVTRDCPTRRPVTLRLRMPGRANISGRWLTSFDALPSGIV
jgi:hypothetical protein